MGRGTNDYFDGFKAGRESVEKHEVKQLKDELKERGNASYASCQTNWGTGTFLEAMSSVRERKGMAGNTRPLKRSSKQRQLARLDLLSYSVSMRTSLNFRKS